MANYKCTKCGNTWHVGGTGGSALPPENCPSGGKHSWIEISRHIKHMVNSLFRFMSK